MVLPWADLGSNHGSERGQSPPSSTERVNLKLYAYMNRFKRRKHMRKHRPLSYSLVSKPRPCNSVESTKSRIHGSSES